MKLFQNVLALMKGCWDPELEPSLEEIVDYPTQWRSQVGAQGARAPPSALGLVDMVHRHNDRTASSSTLLATPNSHLLQKYSLEDS